MDPLDPVVQGILFLVALVLFVIAAFSPPAQGRWNLTAAGLAFAVTVPMWNAFAAS
jgi:hypothetical protein